MAWTLVESMGLCSRHRWKTSHKLRWQPPCLGQRSAGATRPRPVRSHVVSESQLQAVRAAAFVVAILVAALLQRLAPHARLRGSWRVNGALWLVDAVVIGAVCGACAFTASRWAARTGVG